MTDKASILAELKAAIELTTKQINQWRIIGATMVLNVKRQYLVAEASDGSLFVAVVKGKSIGFSYAPLAPESAWLLLNPRDGERYLKALGNDDTLKGKLANMRLVTPREFSALIVPVLKLIVNQTEVALEEFSKPE